jgi:hypothetical protein
MNDWIMGATAANDAYQPLGNDPWTNTIAPRVKELPDVGPPLIPSGGQFSAGVPAVNRLGDIASQVAYDVAVPQTPLDWGITLATGGAGKALSVPAKVAAIAGSHMLTADPAEAASLKLIKTGTDILDRLKPGAAENWHRIANRKLDRPLSDIPFENVGTPPSTTVVTPSSLEGKFVMPLVGDRTIAGTSVKSIDEVPLTTPLETLGGHGYIRNTQGYANDAGMATTIANRVKDIQDRYGVDVVGAHTLMGPQSGDFSHHTWGALSRTLPNAPMTRAAVSELNDAIRTELATLPKGKEWPAFPGVKAKGLEAFLGDQPDAYRKKVINAIEKSRGEIKGAPDLVATRLASTDPELLHAPTNAAGLSMTKLTGDIVPGAHPDFPRHLTGEGNFGLGTLLRREVMFPDLVEHFDKQGQDPAFWQRKMYMPPKDIPHGQLITPRWVDDTSRYLDDAKQMGELAAFDKYILNRFGWK